MQAMRASITAIEDFDKMSQADINEQQNSDNKTKHSPDNNCSLHLPSPITTKRTRTASTSARALENPISEGVVKKFSRSKGHGFITPKYGGEDIFCHISDIEGEYVPLPGDEVKYRLCSIPPKNEKHQAVHVQIVNLTPEAHYMWEDPQY